MMPQFDEMVFGEHYVATSRYRKYILSGDVLHILVDEPRDCITVEGRDNVVAALQEIEACFDPDAEPGWRDIE